MNARLTAQTAFPASLGGLSLRWSRGLLFPQLAPALTRFAFLSLERPKLAWWVKCASPHDSGWSSHSPLLPIVSVPCGRSPDRLLVRTFFSVTRDYPEANRKSLTFPTPISLTAFERKNRIDLDHACSFKELRKASGMIRDTSRRKMHKLLFFMHL